MSSSSPLFKMIVAFFSTRDRFLIPSSKMIRYFFVVFCLVVLSGHHASFAIRNTVDVRSSDQAECEETVISTDAAMSGRHHRRLQNSCEEAGYADRTLKLAYEQPFAGLFLDSKGQQVYELSSVTMAANGMAYAICDSSWAISQFNPKLQTFHPDNVHIGADPFGRNEVDGNSGYESIFVDDQGAAGNQTIYVVRESVLDQNGTYHAVIEELQLTADGTDYTIMDKCPSEFTFSSDNKGFEGAAFIRSLSNEIFVIGLCEGNFCGDDEDTDNNGNGISIIMKKERLPDGSCQWSTYRELQIPASADFTDFSDISIHGPTGRVAITSQEDGKVWIGTLTGQIADTGLWDVDAMAFDMTRFDVYGFPRDQDCNKIFCNVEGKSKEDGVSR
jgi:hypothetical protein